MDKICLDRTRTAFIVQVGWVSGTVVTPCIYSPEPSDFEIENGTIVGQ